MLQPLRLFSTNSTHWKGISFPPNRPKHSLPHLFFLWFALYLNNLCPLSKYPLPRKHFKIRRKHRVRLTPPLKSSKESSLKIFGSRDILEFPFFFFTLEWNSRFCWVRFYFSTTIKAETLHTSFFSFEKMKEHVFSFFRFFFFPKKQKMWCTRLKEIISIKKKSCNKSCRRNELHIWSKKRN